MRIPPQDLVRGEVEQVVQVWSVGWFGHGFWGRNQRNRREFSSVLYVAGTVLGRPGWRPAPRGPGLHLEQTERSMVRHKWNFEPS